MSRTPGPVEATVLAHLAPRFRVRFVPAHGGELRVLEGGEGPPIVLLHGRGSAATSWAPLMPALSRSRRVLAVDLPGFGASSGHRFHGGGAESALAFFVDPIAAWLEGESIEAPVLVGHSLGGLCAIELALRGRVAPRALALIAPMGVGPEATLPGRLFFRLGPERLSRALGPSLFGRILGEESERAAALAHELHAVSGGRPDACRAFDQLTPLHGPMPNERDRLPSIAAPTLVIGGDHDAVFPSPLWIAAAAALPRGELHVEPAGHSPHGEAPERVLGRLTSFLDAHP